MSIIRSNLDGNITFECDDCGELLHTDANEFNEALDAAKREGWIPVKAGNGWEHRCPDCK